MKLVFFLGTSTLFTVAAIPMRPQRSAADPEHVPRVEFGAWRMWKTDKMAAKDIIINHYNGLEPGNEHKGAKLAFATKGWRDGKGPDDEHMQYLDFSYHQGDRPISARIGQTVTVSRVRPPPETHFGQSVLNEHKSELAKVTNKEYMALPPDQAKLVRSMKVHNGWGDGPGLREETRFTYHRNVIPSPNNALGKAVTIYRPMSFLVDGNVPPDQVPTIKKRVRQAYETLDESHPLKQANYGVVIEGWHSNTRGQAVGATMYRVKDKLTDSAEEDFKRIGNFHVPLGSGNSEAEGPSACSTTQDQHVLTECIYLGGTLPN